MCQGTSAFVQDLKGRGEHVACRHLQPVIFIRGRRELVRTGTGRILLAGVNLQWPALLRAGGVLPEVELHGVLFVFRDCEW